MLKHYKYFHFTPFPDKTNDLIFFKNWKTLGAIFDHFWSFLPNGDFSTKKNQPVSHTSPHGPLTCKVSEKTNEPIPRKLPIGQNGALPTNAAGRKATYTWVVLMLADVKNIEDNPPYFLLEHVHRYQTQLYISRKLKKRFLSITSAYLNFRYWNFSHRKKPWLRKYLLHQHHQILIQGRVMLKK